MNHQFTIRFTEETVRYVARKLFFRRIGFWLPALCLLLAGVLVYDVIVGRHDWLVGVELAVLIMGVSISIGLYRVATNLKLSQFRAMKKPTVQYELSDEILKTTSDTGSSEVKWEVVTGLLLLPRAWLLKFRTGGYLTLPTDQINDDVRAFLKQKIARIGGKIE